MEQQELIWKLQQGHQASRELEERAVVVDQQITELERFKTDLSELKESEEKEILASLGKGVFIKSEIIDRKLFVDVGSGVFVRKDQKEAQNVIENQLTRLGEMKEGLDKEMINMHKEMQDLIKDIEKSDK